MSTFFWITACWADKQKGRFICALWILCSFAVHLLSTTLKAPDRAGLSSVTQESLAKLTRSLHANSESLTQIFCLVFCVRWHIVSLTELQPRSQMLPIFQSYPKIHSARNDELDYGVIRHRSGITTGTLFGSTGFIHNKPHSEYISPRLQLKCNL